MNGVTVLINGSPHTYVLCDVCGDDADDSPPEQVFRFEATAVRGPFRLCEVCAGVYDDEGMGQ